MDFVGTVWALLPPVIAIVLALITKEVYMSLFIGVVTGALLYTNFSPVGTIEAIFEVMMEKLGDSWNVGILIFLVFLGIIVALMTRAGGSAAYGKWAGSKIKTRSGALLSTFALGVVIFVDDYFNCLTVGSVMREITDEFKVSRAMLAYIIDSRRFPVRNWLISLTQLQLRSALSHRSQAGLPQSPDTQTEMVSLSFCRQSHLTCMHGSPF